MLTVKVLKDKKERCSDTSVRESGVGVKGGRENEHFGGLTPLWRKQIHNSFHQQE
jgi:hypothetical protein